MKLRFIFAIFLIFQWSQHNGVESRTIVGDKINEYIIEALEMVRTVLKEGGFGLPAMDPLEVETFNIKFDDVYFGMDCKTKHDLFQGISDFIIENVDFKFIPFPHFKFNFTFPQTFLKAGSYDFLGLLFSAIPLYGNGSAEFEVGNVQLDGRIDFKVSTSTVYKVKDIKINLRMEKIVSRTTGMLGGGDIDDLINAIVEDLAPPFFNYGTAIVTDTFSKTMVDKINEMIDNIFNGMKIKDLLQYHKMKYTNLQ